MRITIITNEYSSEGGGLSYSCRRFHHLLEELDNEVSILSSGIDETSVISSGYDAKLGMEIAYEAKMKRDVGNIISSQLLIAFGGGFNAYYAALLAEKKNIRLWLMLRGSDGNLAKWNTESSFYLNYSAALAERIICLSKELVENTKLLTRKQLEFDVIPNHSERKIRIVKPIRRGNLHLGCGASHMNEKKGVSNLIKLVSVYNQKYDNNIMLDIVGEIDNEVMDQYKEKVNHLCLQSCIRFINRKNREEYRLLQQCWDMYIQTSVCEGMGNSVTDSMSVGIPVMISNTGFIAELAREQFHQMVFSADSPEVMADEIHSNIQDEKICDKYKLFYDMFFETVSTDCIKKKWRNLLRNNNQENIKPELDCIISVSLHDIAGDKHDNITTPVETFRKFNEDIHNVGYRLCSMKDYVSMEIEDRKRCIVCTFDDGYVGLLLNALPIMNEFGFTATVFVCTDYLGKVNDWNFKDKSKRQHLSIDELKELQSCGWEVGSHGVTHRSLLRLNDEDLCKELQTSKDVLESLFGPVKSYAYPYGDYSDYIMKQVSRFYDFAFLLTQGGTFLEVDSLRIHRYYISEINQILKINQ